MGSLKGIYMAREGGKGYHVPSKVSGRRDGVYHVPDKGRRGRRVPSEASMKGKWPERILWPLRRGPGNMC